MTDTTADRRYASRKFRIAVGVLVVAWAAFPFGLFTPEQLLDFSKWIVGLYMAGNVGDTAAEGLHA